MTINITQFVKENRDYLIKQSEMLQSIISRMASNSLTIKQLGITIWTTLMGFGFAYKLPSLFILAMISFLLLGFLDIYYLYLERQFRDNFKRLTTILCGYHDSLKLEDKKYIEQFQGNFLTREKLSAKQTLQLYLRTLKSWTNLLYLIILIVTLIIVNTL